LRSQYPNWFSGKSFFWHHSLRLSPLAWKDLMRSLHNSCFALFAKKPTPLR
jgi:hypothetical protein